MQFLIKTRYKKLSAVFFSICRQNPGSDPQHCPEGSIKPGSGKQSALEICSAILSSTYTVGQGNDLWPAAVVKSSGFSISSFTVIFCLQIRRRENSAENPAGRKLMGKTQLFHQNSTLLISKRFKYQFSVI